MRRRKVLIRHLDAVETLGSVQVICLDKTGTITKNRMSVVAAHVGLTSLAVAEGRFLLEGKALDPFASGELLRLLHVGALCNECELNGGKEGWVVQGTPTEGALVELALAAGVDVPALRRRHPRRRVRYRAENRLFMATLHGAERGRHLIAVKGSPPEVLSLCRWAQRNGGKRALKDEEREAILRENEHMAGRALRVLGFAYALSENDSLDAPVELVWLGLVGMADPVREGVGRLIRTFHRAGIETVMITGDQSATAHAIGRELGLANGRPLEILDTTHLEQLAPDVLSALAQRVNVFARVSPAQKLQIVQALQRADKVVAMTGDGINDGPALKTADIGVAMGDTGTDVARTVADVVLEDDNLQTMIVAVSRGRTIYSNIRKAIHYLLSTNLSEIEVMLLSIAAGTGQPLNPMQLLWINLVTDIFPALALAVEPPEPDVLNRPPRDPAEPIITVDEVKRVALESTAISAGTLAAYGFALARYGPGPAANTVAFMTLTLAQIIHAVSCRSRHHGIFSAERMPPNPYLNLAVGGSLATQAACLALPPMRSFLGLVPVGLPDLAAIAAGAALPFLVSEATKGAPPAKAARSAAVPVIEGSTP
jgi:Ca2+-transporting ATPase